MTRARPAPAVGLFGLLGSGNLGNQASAEAMLAYLQRAHPDAEVDAMSTGPQWVRDNYGIPAVPFFWQERHGPRPVGLLPKIVGKFADPLRIVRWVRRHDMIIVPGMGVLEASLPMRPYGIPLTMFVLAAAGRFFGVKIALVSVGTSVVTHRATRWLFVAAARMAHYRSFRDEYSKTAMHVQGLDTRRDRVFPDLVFSREIPLFNPGDAQVVALGVMDYHGGDDDRARAGELHSAYLEEMARFVVWLLGRGYQVRLLGGDSSCDYTAVADIITRLCRVLPTGQVAEAVTVPSFTSYAEMLEEMNRAGTVVATRFHNVIGGLLLGKPTIAVGYSRKFADLMADTGLPEFVRSADDIDAGWLEDRFRQAQARKGELSELIVKRNAARAAAVDGQFAELSTLLATAGKAGRRRGLG